MCRPSVFAVLRTFCDARVVAIAVACWLALSDQLHSQVVLLDDNFNDGVLDPTLWTTNTNIVRGPASVREQNGRVELRNRGHLITAQQFDPLTTGPLRITGTWTFLSPPVPQHDVLAVLTRSDGVPTGSFGETNNGISFVANQAGNIGINLTRNGVSTQLAAPVPFTISSGSSYAFEVRDDGRNLSFSMAEVGLGPAITLAPLNVTTVTAVNADVFATNRVVFHNREATQGNHTAYLDNVLISSLAPPPGERAAPDPATNSRNLVVVTHGWAGSNPDDAFTQAWTSDMASAIHSQLMRRPDSDDWEVTVFNWTESSERALNSNTITPNRAFNNAQRLGIEQGGIWGEAEYEHVHLIGFSAGAGFLDAAARLIKSKSPATSVQLTFLDGFFQRELGEQGMGQAADWAEHYFVNEIFFGRQTKSPLAAGHNVDLSGLFDVPKHFLPVEFYRHSIDGASFHSTIGSEFPGELSPVPDGAFSRAVVGGTFLPYGFELSKEAGHWFPELDSELRSKLAIGNPAVRFDGRLAEPVLLFPPVPSSPTILASVSSASGLVSVGDDSVSLTTGSPAWTILTLDVGNAADMLQFNVEFTSDTGAEGLLVFYFDGEYLGALDERYALDGNASYRWLLDETVSGVHELSFRLDAFTSVASSVEITDIQFLYAAPAVAAVPEPASIYVWLALAVPMAGLVVSYRRLR